MPAGDVDNDGARLFGILDGAANAGGLIDPYLGSDIGMLPSLGMTSRPLSSKSGLDPELPDDEDADDGAVIAAADDARVLGRPRPPIMTLVVAVVAVDTAESFRRPTKPTSDDTVDVLWYGEALTREYERNLIRIEVQTEPRSP